MKMNILLLTCTDEKEADKVIHSLLNKRLIVCAKKTPVTSSFIWKSKIESEMRKPFKYLFLALILISAISFVQFSRQFEKEVGEQKTVIVRDKTEEMVESQQGKYLDYSYTILSKEQESQYVATFNPFYPGMTLSLLEQC